MKKLLNPRKWLCRKWRVLYVKTGFAEVELGFTKDDAIKEACRCLRCDAVL